MTTTIPTRYCDLVMKGGITSGVVYPLAAAKLSEQFVFKNIGGTSAGAIAAAATAAAELARERNGFETLKALPAFLCGDAPDKSGSNLSGFFQPQPCTTRLFRLGMSALGGGWAAWRRVGWRLLTSYFLAWFVGALPGLLFLWATWRSASGLFFVGCIAVGALALLIGALLGLSLALLRDVGEIPENFYGLCSGMTDDFFDTTGGAPATRAKPLTYWLCEYLNAFVDRKPTEAPLIFGDLWGTHDPSAPRKVNLEMMTTCLTHGRPYRLPFRDDHDIRENTLFFFRPDEFRRLFPKAIVDWMIANPRALTDKNSAQRRLVLKEKGFLPLPDPADFPVVVAVRMSLSFPILLSAVPLHAVDRNRDPNGENPECCWFSDGGVCSNFPIHFFDSPLPRWPTLSINLVEKPAGTDATDLLEPQMPENNGGNINENWNRFEVTERLDRDGSTIIATPKSSLKRLVAFVGAFIPTMQNWSDNVQSRLPGYRDRIAAVGLTPDEGGLNLNMPKKRIEDLTARGQAAGVEFVRRFGDPAAEPKMNWANHRWLRLRSCLASMEALLVRIDSSCTNPVGNDLAYEAWIKATPINESPGYAWSGLNQQACALAALSALRKVTAEINLAKCSLADDAPRPRPELRTRAQV